VKRFVDDPGAVHGKCRELAEYITKGASISNFTQHGLAEQVFTSLIALEKMPVTPDQDRKARELVAEFEEHRLARMRGLAP